MRPRYKWDEPLHVSRHEIRKKKIGQHKSSSYFVGQQSSAAIFALDDIIKPSYR